jgi:hypothetical protein
MTVAEPVPGAVAAVALDPTRTVTLAGRLIEVVSGRMTL